MDQPSQQVGTQLNLVIEGGVEKLLTSAARELAARPDLAPAAVERVERAAQDVLVAMSRHGIAHEGVVAGLGLLGDLLREVGDPEGAHPYFQHSVRIAERVFPPDDPRMATIRSHLAGSLFDLGRTGDAHSEFEEVLRIDRATHGPEHLEVALDLYNLARVSFALGDPTNAHAQLEDALRIAEAQVGPNDPRVLAMRKELTTRPQRPQSSQRAQRRSNRARQGSGGRSIMQIVQPNQRVGTQVIVEGGVSGTMHVGGVGSGAELVGVLNELETQLGRLMETGGADGGAVARAREQVGRAIARTTGETRDRTGIVRHLRSARELLAGVGSAVGVAKALEEVINQAQGLLR